MRRWTFAGLWLALIAGCAGSPDVERVDSAPLGGQLLARPCRGDAFAVEVPLARPVLWADTSFLAGVQQDMEAAVAASAADWFCGPDQLTCPTGQVSVEGYSVLPVRPWPRGRADGHLRFLRLRFRAGGQTLSVRPQRQCAVVAALRAAVSLHTGLTATDDFYVGRECEAQAAGADALPSATMLGWHLAAMGAGSPPPLVPPPPGADLVDLALIDSGVHPAVADRTTGLGVASSQDLLRSAPGLHPHGTALAILLRQLAPLAAIHDRRALDAGGNGAGEVLAQALDEALFAAGAGARPLVVNLSLAWPRELSRPALITGPGCVSYEDSFGEAVRYVLDAARQADEAGERPIFVSAAAGNQPLAAPAGLFPPEPAGPVLDPLCSAQSLSAPAWHLPAEWHRLDSCRSDSPAVRRLAFAASAVDPWLRPAALGIAGAESPLVAPGEGVYAAHPAAPAAVVAPMCGASGTPYPPPLHFPFALSGSSVSAALIAAAAARAQTTLAARREAPLGATALGRLLYLTGQDLCRGGAAPPTRLLHVARLDQALARCPSLIACARSASGAEPIPADLLQQCTSPLVACGLERRAGPGLAQSCARLPARPGWSTTYLAQRTVCGTFTGGSAGWQDGAAQAHRQGAVRGLLASIGPQPTGPVCPDCRAQRVQEPLAIELELNKDLVVGTSVVDPVLELRGPSRTVPGLWRTYVYDLSTLTTPADWTPGAHLDLELDVEGVDLHWAKTSEIKTTLLTTVQAPGAKDVRDVSPLAFEVGP